MVRNTEGWAESDYVSQKIVNKEPASKNFRQSAFPLHRVVWNEWNEKSCRKCQWVTEFHSVTRKGGFFCRVGVTDFHKFMSLWQNLHPDEGWKGFINSSNKIALSWLTVIAVWPMQLQISPQFLCWFEWVNYHCQFGLAVRCWAGKQRDLSSNPLWLSFLWKSCGLWTLSCDFVLHN